MKTSLYIHIPFCVSKCSYCDFFSVPLGKNNVPDGYVDSLCREIQIKKKERHIESFDTIYIGGGTPSILSGNQLKKIVSSAVLGCDESPSEITIECNPCDITEEFLSEVSAAGINRLSVGIQTFSEKSLECVCRRSSSENVVSALKLIKKNWKGIFSADLISGLPFESEKSFKNTIKNLVKYKPDHISMYSLIIEDSTPLGKAFSAGTFSYDFEKADKLWLFGRDFLEKKGYRQYEVSNFCKKGFECAHNLVYWNLKDYEGCGSGATSSFYGPGGFRFTNTKDIEKYILFWSDCKADLKSAPGEKELLSLKTQEFEFFMMGLRTLHGISEKEFEKRFSHSFSPRFLNLFEKWKKKHLCKNIKKHGDKIYALNKKGILFLNAFLEELI